MDQGNPCPFGFSSYCAVDTVDFNGDDIEYDKWVFFSMVFSIELGRFDSPWFCSLVFVELDLLEDSGLDA